MAYKIDETLRYIISNWYGVYMKNELKELLTKIIDKDIIPTYTLSHLNINKINIADTPATAHRVTFSGTFSNRELPIIVFNYGFIYLGKAEKEQKWKVWEKEQDEWKVIWFENINDGTIENKMVKLYETRTDKKRDTKIKSFEFTPCDDKPAEFTNFICALTYAFNSYVQILDLPNKTLFDTLYLSALTACKQSGGQRKTKRSKRTRRNKKCKRCTRRS